MLNLNGEYTSPLLIRFPKKPSPTTFLKIPIAPLISALISFPVELRLFILYIYLVFRILNLNTIKIFYLKFIRVL